MAQKRDEDNALALLNRIIMRATRHHRAADGEADLRMDLAAIAGDAEELQGMLNFDHASPIAEAVTRAGREAAKRRVIENEYLRRGRDQEPEVGLSWGGSSLMDAMEEAVEAKERAETAAEDAERFEALVHVGESAQHLYESRKPFVFNGSVYLVGKAYMEQLGRDLERYRELLQRYLVRKRAENREKRGKG